MKRPTIARAIAAVLAAVASTPAFAHVGAAGHVHGFTQGFMHPMGGLDHILAMLAVGMMAANLGGRALWQVPTVFVLIMAAGGALGAAQIGLPFVEIGIAMSVIVLGALVAMRLPISSAAAMAIVACFAIFHGYAHGSEMPADASGLQFAIGFMLATALLHISGIAIGLGIIENSGRVSAAHLAKVSGTAMSLAGVGLMAGWL